MATQTGASAADQAKQTAQQATEQVRGAAQQGAQQARVQVRDQVDQRSTQVGEQATTAADAIKQASSHLREQGSDGPARLLDQAAGHVEKAGTWLQESDGDRILHDVEDFARRQPLAVIAGGVAVGFALSRLLKASSRDRYERGGERPVARQIPARTSPATAGYGDGGASPAVPRTGVAGGTAGLEDDLGATRPRGGTPGLEDDFGATRPRGGTARLEDDLDTRRPRGGTAGLEDDLDTRRPGTTPPGTGRTPL